MNGTDTQADLRDCPSTAEYCRCRHTILHSGPHECIDQAHCKGAWYGSMPIGQPASADFRVVRYPWI